MDSPFFVVISDSFNPYLNLAVESYLLSTAQAPLLYLWQNDKTVVIGHNQNPYYECNVSNLLSVKGKLARRITGGGAVYHDVNNLNYSIIVPTLYYDENRQFNTLIKALSMLGIEAIRSGRNDLTTLGRKFSGNAFHKGKNNCLQHGTILIDTDVAMLSKLLTPNKSKLIKKGVSSVEARVINLCEIDSRLNAEAVKVALISAFTQEYGKPNILAFMKISHKSEVEALTNKYSDNEYVYGKHTEKRGEKHGSFDWGEVEISYEIIGGDTIAELNIYSDSLYPLTIDMIQELLLGYEISHLKSIENPFSMTEKRIFDDIIKLLTE